MQILPKNQIPSLSILQVRIKQLAVNFDRAKCRSCATNAVVKHVRSSATARRLYSMRFQMSTFQLHEQGAKWTWSPQNGGNFHTKIILRKIKFYPCCEGYGSGFEPERQHRGDGTFNQRNSPRNLVWHEVVVKAHGNNQNAGHNKHLQGWRIGDR